MKLNKKQKQEIINLIKACKNTEDFTTNNMCGFYDDEEKKFPKPIPVFCDVCKKLIDIFNLTIEDLKPKKSKENKKQ